MLLVMVLALRGSIPLSPQNASSSYAIVNVRSKVMLGEGAAATLAPLPDQAFLAGKVGV
jgi:hypothetical protein